MALKARVPSSHVPTSLPPSTVAFGGGGSAGVAPATGAARLSRAQRARRSMDRCSARECARVNPSIEGSGVRRRVGAKRFEERPQVLAVGSPSPDRIGVEGAAHLEATGGAHLARILVEPQAARVPGQAA